MPIATCHVLSMPDNLGPSDVVDAWSRLSGIEPEEMTVDLVTVQQGGKRYQAIAWLYLPSLWPDEAVAALATGLAGALAEVLDVESSSVQVLVSILTSGLVVEAGEIMHW
jgi:hypothetical protein